MLRGLKGTHLGAYLNGAITYTDGSASYAIVGGQDFYSLTRDAAGATSCLINGSQRFARLPVHVGSSLDTTAGTYCIDNGSTASTMKTGGKTAAGAASSIAVSSLLLGWMSEETDTLSSVHSVKNWARNPRLLIGRVGATAGALSSYSVTCTNSATGTFALAYKNAFGRNYTPVVATPIGHAQKGIRVGGTGVAASKSGCTVYTYDSSETLENNAFYFAVLGWDANEEQGGLDRVVQVPFRGPKIIGGKVDDDGTILVGTGDFTATKEATTGLYTIDFTTSFSCEPVVLAMGTTARTQVYEPAVAGQVQLMSFNATGTAEDRGFCFLAIGQDEFTSYASGDTGTADGITQSSDYLTT